MLTLTRFLRFLILATLLLLIPAFVYLSQGTSSPVRDPKTGEWIWQGMLQSIQGHGPYENNPPQERPYHPLTDWRKLLNNVMPTHPAKEHNYNNQHRPVLPPQKTEPAVPEPVRFGHTSAVLSSLDVPAVKIEPKVDGAYAPAMTNATAKAELGRSTWRFLHTMMARFPENPTPQQVKICANSSTCSLYYTHAETARRTSSSYSRNGHLKSARGITQSYGYAMRTTRLTRACTSLSLTVPN